MDWSNISCVNKGQARFLLEVLALSYSEGGPQDSDLVWHLLQQFPDLEKEFSYLPKRVKT